MSNIVFSSGGILVCEYKKNYNILLITTSNGLLSFPKGHVEYGENFEQTAIRELREETGLKDCLINEFLGKIIRIGTEHDGSKKEKHIYLFSISGTGFLGVHEENFVWVDIRDAIKLMKYEEESQFLVDHMDTIIKNAISADMLDIPNIGNIPKGIYDTFQIMILLKQKYDLGIDLNRDNIVYFAPENKNIKQYENILSIHTYTDNLLQQQLSDDLRCICCYNTMELSNTKLFFTLNMMIKKIVRDGYIIIVSDFDKIFMNRAKDIGGGLIKYNNSLKQKRIYEDIINIIDKLKLESIACCHYLGEKNIIYTIVKKVSDYVY